MMWLKITYNEDDILKWPSKANTISVAVINSVIAPITEDFKSFRISPIFSLNPLVKSVPIENATIAFYNFPNAYSVLGRIDKLASDDLKGRVFFCLGLSSVILITENEANEKEFDKVTGGFSTANEKWTLNDSLIIDIDYKIPKNGKIDIDVYKLEDYSNLPVTERVLIDEFNAGIRMMLIKLINHMPSEIGKIKNLINDINSMIGDLTYLQNPKGKPPHNLSEFSVNDLRDARQNSIMRNQILDRIIQVNSSLSYVSTQAFSGAIPILERRSLVRRHSLLGIGSSILALNNIARFVEECFANVSIFDTIITSMAHAAPLKGTDNLLKYDSSEWHKSSVGTFGIKPNRDSTFFKLPFFNGRLGFRETEYSIAAAIQSISSGATLEWSLMTLTHEMLHGHVRKILNSIFFGNDLMNRNDQRNLFYERFVAKQEGKLTDEKLIDSIRSVIFTYCCYTTEFGSITSQTEPPEDKFRMPVLELEKLWSVFEHEYRNINELFVHILDLHYFYANRVSVYIPLIWCSWVAVPYTSGDLRQYILRSVLTISSKVDGSIHIRWKESIGILKGLLVKYQESKLNYPIIQDVIDILNNEELLRVYYFPAFKASIIIVDLVKNIFFAEQIRSAIFNDDLVAWESEEHEDSSLEKSFYYNLDEGFNDEVIASPIAYLLDKMIKELNSGRTKNDIERETAIQFLALNSN